MTTYAERFWAKVTKGPAADSCWEWTASKRRGYGQFFVGAGRIARAHRVSYQLLVGPIPEGLDLDHLCRNRSCVNPAHLEPVTRRENTLRGASPTVAIYHGNTCMNGHEFTPENVTTDAGMRRCRTCRNASCRRSNKRRQARGDLTPKSPREACRRGHVLTPENVYTRSNGERECAVCKRERRNKERQK